LIVLIDISFILSIKWLFTQGICCRGGGLKISLLAGFEAQNIYVDQK
jgi:hypothetical protein